jgi:hypothetical protein
MPSPHNFDVCYPRGLPSEHGVMGIHPQANDPCKVSLLGLARAQGLRRGSEVTSAHLSERYARTSIQDGYIYGYDG